MEIALSDLRHQSVRLPSGKTTGIKNMYIDANTGKILFLSCARGFLSTDEIFSDHDQWVFRGKIVHEYEGENWMNFRVYNRKQHFRGKVVDIFFEPQNFYITKIESHLRFLGMTLQKKLFPADDIFQVLSAQRRIIVEEENRIFRADRFKLPNFNPFPSVSPASRTFSSHKQSKR